MKLNNELHKIHMTSFFKIKKQYLFIESEFYNNLVGKLHESINVLSNVSSIIHNVVYDKE